MRIIQRIQIHSLDARIKSDFNGIWKRFWIDIHFRWLYKSLTHTPSFLILSPRSLLVWISIFKQFSWAISHLCTPKTEAREKNIHTAAYMKMRFVTILYDDCAIIFALWVTASCEPIKWVALKSENCSTISYRITSHQRTSVCNVCMSSQFLWIRWVYDKITHLISSKRLPAIT